VTEGPRYVQEEVSGRGGCDVHHDQNQTEWVRGVNEA
jgi:hypothetical protein